MSAVSLRFEDDRSSELSTIIHQVEATSSSTFKQKRLVRNTTRLGDRMRIGLDTVRLFEIRSTMVGCATMGTPNKIAKTSK